MADHPQQTVIGPDTHIKGDMTFENTARLLGSFEGRIAAKGELQIADSAVCRAAVEAGKVTIDGTEVPLTGQGWKDSAIEVLVPAHDQPGASGDVVVDVDGRKSNPVQLTMWKVTVRLASSTV